MKKTFNINIGGMVFTIDDDAYTLLNDYLKTLENAFSRQSEGKEVVADIETRVAELLQEVIAQGSLVITVADVEHVIARIGKPEDIVDVEAENMETPEGESIKIDVNETTATPPPFNPERFHRKLFRDPLNGILGGVCAGLGEYFGIDVSLMRLIAVILLFASAGTATLIYIILWIVLPEAVTPLQRMQLTGVSPTVENIGKTVTDTFRRENGDSEINAESANDNNHGFWGCVGKFLKIIALVIAVPLLVLGALGIIGCVLGIIVLLVADDNIYNNVHEYFSVLYGVACAIGYIIVFGIPLAIFVRYLTNKRTTTLSKEWMWGLLSTWLLGLVIAGVFTGMHITEEKAFEDYWRKQQREWRKSQEAKEAKEAMEIDIYIDDEGDGIYEIPTLESISDSTVTAGKDSLVVTKKKRLSSKDSAKIRAADRKARNAIRKADEAVRKATRLRKQVERERE